MLAPVEPSDGAAPAADGADAGTGAADAREGERLVRRRGEPRALIPRGTAQQLHLLMHAGLHNDVAIDAGHHGRMTFSRLPRRGAINVQMALRQRARGVGFARRTAAHGDARRARREDAQSPFVVEAVEAAEGGLSLIHI